MQNELEKVQSLVIDVDDINIHEEKLKKLQEQYEEKQQDKKEDTEDTTPFKEEILLDNTDE